MIPPDCKPVIKGNESGILYRIVDTDEGEEGHLLVRGVRPTKSTVHLVDVVSDEEFDYTNEGVAEALSVGVLGLK